nr:hypothetical protein CFP56_39542 [Quercus suber]
MAPSTLVVKNLSEDVTEDDLEELFSKEGPFDSVDFESSTHGVVKFCTSNFVAVMMFDSETSATNAIKFFNGAEKYGMKFLVSKYNDCKKLCVEYHPKDLDENNILLAFSLYGECIVNIENKSSGIAFVSYHISEGAEGAMWNLNGTDLAPLKNLMEFDDPYEHLELWFLNRVLQELGSATCELKRMI